MPSRTVGWTLAILAIVLVIVPLLGMLGRWLVAEAGWAWAG